MSTINKAEEIAKTINKTIEKIIPVRSTGTFTAIDEAREVVIKAGFKHGIMCSDAPIAIAPGDFDYIAKWYNISRDEWKHLEGVIVSEDFREGDCYICYFK